MYTTSPEDCKKSKIILILKREGDRKNTENYRPINLINGIAKIFSFLIKSRIIGCLDVQEKKNGFKRSYLTIDHIYNQLTENSRKY